jgi:hypothetical protein
LCITSATVRDTVTLFSLALRTGLLGAVGRSFGQRGEALERHDLAIT